MLPLHLVRLILETYSPSEVQLQNELDCSVALTACCASSEITGLRSVRASCAPTSAATISGNSS